MAGTDIGSLIDGRFRVIDKLGEGGMSIVWLARDERLEKLWAIKEVKLNSNDGLYRANIAATRQEANIMKRLDHPSLPRIVDVVDDGDSLLVVMDYVQGKDLLDRLKERGTAFAEKDVIDWGIQLCDALGYLHAQDPPIIYRDMKPGNVILQEDGTVKIIDFGIAREYKEGQTLDTTPLGTRGYAPPEAFVAGHKSQTDPRSDVYTLGVTLFHLVTGHSPMEYVTQPNLPPIRSVNPALSPGLEAIIIKATDWDPNNRQQSCDELRYELENPPDSERQQWMRRQVSLFKGLVIGGAVCVLLGIGSLVASNLVRNSSFDGLVNRAATANTQETADGGPSEAEQLLTEAISIKPADIKPYSMLVNDVYKDDSTFTISEADRWERLFAANNNSIEGLPYYDKLCFDVGIDYYMWFNYGGEENRTAQAAKWFERANAAFDAAPDSTHQQTPDRKSGEYMSTTDRSSADVYITIGTFDEVRRQALEEGREKDAISNYFDAIVTAVSNAGSPDGGYEKLVQLRLYDLVFSTLSSPVYLNDFRAAGISKDRVISLMNQTRQQATDVWNEESKRSDVGDRMRELHESIERKANSTQANINNVYEGAGEVGAEMTGERSE